MSNITTLILQLTRIQNKLLSLTDKETSILLGERLNYWQLQDMNKFIDESSSYLEKLENQLFEAKPSHK